VMRSFVTDVPPVGCTAHCARSNPLLNDMWYVSNTMSTQKLPGVSFKAIFKTNDTI
jgi:hypothetical protein